MGCADVDTEKYKNEYGVYLSDNYSELPEDVSCETIVIDAQYYSKKEIAELKETNGTVLSYLNVGSIEDFRDYFPEYEDLILGPYENWEEEYWVNVADERWQDFVVKDLAKPILNKGVDGFFIDNTDVYYNYNNDGVYQGLTNILMQLKNSKAQIVINGGDAYVSKYLEENGNLDGILDGVNQESVYTSIDFDNKSFAENDEETRDYYLEYLNSVVSHGKKAYVLEYTDDSKLKDFAVKECHKKEFIVYVSDSIELD
jgi:uncharacterized protein (TIGR01370 family)